MAPLCGAPNRVRVAMALAGVSSQSDLAAKSGVDQTVISRTLKGGHRLTLSTAKRLAAAFGVGVDDLFPIE